MVPKVILFDLDDTLVCFDGVVKQAWQKTCDLFATKLKNIQATELYNAIRKVGHWYWSDPSRHREGRLNLEETRRKNVKQALVNLGINHETLAYELADYYSQLQESMIYLFEDAHPTLKQLKNKNTKLGLVTNGNAKMQKRKIKRFNLEPFFDAFFIEGELGFGKPDPRVYQLALKQFNIKANETWMVGDNLEWDVQAPQKIGISGIWKHNDYADPEESDIKPNRIIKQLSELLF